jgi:hypothetical protein
MGVQQEALVRFTAVIRQALMRRAAVLHHEALRAVLSLPSLPALCPFSCRALRQTARLRTRQRRVARAVGARRGALLVLLPDRVEHRPVARWLDCPGGQQSRKRNREDRRWKFAPADDEEDAALSARRPSSSQTRPRRHSNAHASGLRPFAPCPRAPRRRARTLARCPPPWKKSAFPFAVVARPSAAAATHLCRTAVVLVRGRPHVIRLRCPILARHLRRARLADNPPATARLSRQTVTCKQTQVKKVKA